ncbi:hypothetical protein HOD30_01935 [Candidatus Peregrinibacteria bacterium]|jgi:hypothetical protein|nr:hypothetical protein [Candidatus Peregrinibacteria bacterium]MBT4631778.1 hypothetical protein [Candidatus Peregrinibacteria bacterium]MBT5516841.1 hypothetical protein [Candidatus Peregrinibacteria bacterium]MBT5824497.1 hypothetical protein [Candidatus Peregrinibacteria bacterium]
MGSNGLDEWRVWNEDGLQSPGFDSDYGAPDLLGGFGKAILEMEEEDRALADTLKKTRLKLRSKTE